MNKGYIPEGEVATNYSDSSSLNELSSLTKISIHSFENAPFFYLLLLELHLTNTCLRGNNTYSKAIATQGENTSA